jgi:AcrR family transcriptional regulator
MFKIMQDVFMSLSDPIEIERKRAPSKRSLATRKRILDAAESIFARIGFDGATIRDIASEAGEPIGSVHHHGRGKETLFHQVVARRAETLSKERLAALDAARAAGPLSVTRVLDAFMRPFLDLSRDDEGWQNYARIVAFVSTDDRWHPLAATYFDPTAEQFLAEFATLLPQAERRDVAEGFVYCVSAMLAFVTSQARIGGLGGEQTAEKDAMEGLLRFSTAGLLALGKEA